jgi:DNA-binding transcriptional LysR family regulator
MDRHQQMSVFTTVAREQGLAAASRSLGVSQATISRALAALEKRLGAQLLKRTTRGVTLTEVGRVFADECERLLRLADEADASANGLHVEPKGLLTLVMPLLFGNRLLMPIILDYLDTWPGVEVSVTYSDRFPNLHEEGVDVAVLIGALPDAFMVAREVGAVRQIICASPDYLRQRPTLEKPADLADHAVVVCSADNRMQEWRLRQDGVTRVASLKPVLRCTTPTSAVEAAVRGTGLVCCLEHQAHEHLQAGRLVAVLQAFEPAPVPVYLVYREGRRASARVRSFVDFAVERLRQHPVLSA